MMKNKLMPMLVGAIALSVVATPFIVKAQSNLNDQSAPAQGTHQGRWESLNLTDEQKEQMRQIHEDTRTQIQAILTPQQLEQFNAISQNPQDQQAHRGRRAAMAALNLSDEQKEKMKEIMEEKKTRMQAILTPEQQQQLEQQRQQWQQRRQQQGNQ